MQFSNDKRNREVIFHHYSQQRIRYSKTLSDVELLDKGRRFFDLEYDLISMIERKREDFILNKAKNADDAQASASIFNEMQDEICRL